MFFFSADSQFSQQELPALKLILTPGYVMFTNFCGNCIHKN